MGENKRYFRGFVIQLWLFVFCIAWRLPKYYEPFTVSEIYAMEGEFPGHEKEKEKS
jgi:hypothetical protein